MKQLLIAASTLVSATAIASAAQAADIAPGSYDWTGVYAGVNAGAAWNNSESANDFRYEGERVQTLTNQINGDQIVFTAGGIIGYNYQIDQMVLGAEADINYLGFSDKTKRSRDWTNDGYPGLTTSSQLSFEGNWYGTLRGRLGYAADNLLFYGTGGLAYGHMSAEGNVKAKYGPDDVTWDGSTDSTNWGWTIGAGMEYGIDNWSLGVEYLFVDLGSAEWDADRSGPLADMAQDTDAKGSVDYQFSVVRATAKLRF